MDMATYTRESSLNRQAYERLREDVKRKHAGKYVALANGQVIGAEASFDAACALIDALESVPEYYLVFPAGEEPDFELAYDPYEKLERI